MALYCGPSIVRLPIKKNIWRDIFVENVRMASLIFGIKEFIPVRCPYG